MRDEDYMKIALYEAQLAGQEGEVPIGAVIVHDGKVIATGRNRRENGKSALAHAEIEAIKEACQIIDGWRLIDCDLYVTLEPCPMCAGAIINSRIRRVIYGAYDKKAGSCGSVINLFELPYNHRPIITPGILENECADILSDFFKDIRRRN